MNANDDDAYDAVLRKLDQLAPLTDADRLSIRSLPFQIRSAKAGAYLVREGSSADTCCVLLSGYVCRHKLTSKGGRQIVSFHLPGDIVNLQHLLLARADHSVQAITDVRFAAVSAALLKRLVLGAPNLVEALWRDTLIDASVFREWVLNVGRRDARTRIAHMLCEFATRRQAAGLGSPTSFELPMTQEHIADATGLTTVHVNRTLALLSDEGLISRQGRRVEILDWARMRTAADFDPVYLHALAA